MGQWVEAERRRLDLERRQREAAQQVRAREREVAQRARSQQLRAGWTPPGHRRMTSVLLAVAVGDPAKVMFSRRSLEIRPTAPGNGTRAYPLLPWFAVAAHDFNHVDKVLCVVMDDLLCPTGSPLTDVNHAYGKVTIPRWFVVAAKLLNAIIAPSSCLEPVARYPATLPSSGHPCSATRSRSRKFFISADMLNQ